jgi:hypothetical protein
LHGGEIEHRFVDQKEVGAEIVNQHQQREARQPRRIGFPFEPGQAVRHLRRRHQVFHHVVKAAAMDLPFVALDAGRQPGPRPQAQIQVDEIKRAANPRDSRDDMQPAEDGACRFSEYQLHDLAPRDVGSPHLTPGKFTMTDPMQPAQAYRPWHDFGQLSTLSPFAGADFVG